MKKLKLLLLILGAILLMASQAEGACHTSYAGLRAGSSGHYRYRVVDGRHCWYVASERPAHHNHKAAAKSPPKPVARAPVRVAAPPLVSGAPLQALLYGPEAPIAEPPVAAPAPAPVTQEITKIDPIHRISEAFSNEAFSQDTKLNSYLPAVEVQEAKPFRVCVNTNELWLMFFLTGFGALIFGIAIGYFFAMREGKVKITKGERPRN
jgi:hypothetical protein